MDSNKSSVVVSHRKTLALRVSTSGEHHSERKFVALKGNKVCFFLARKKVGSKGRVTHLHSDEHMHRLRVLLPTIVNTGNLYHINNTSRNVSKQHYKHINQCINPVSLFP
jgi:hypothetical protein